MQFYLLNYLSDCNCKYISGWTWKIVSIRSYSKHFILYILTQRFLVSTNDNCFPCPMHWLYRSAITILCVKLTCNTWIFYGHFHSDKFILETSLSISALVIPLYSNITTVIVTFTYVTCVLCTRYCEIYLFRCVKNWTSLRVK